MKKMSFLKSVFVALVMLFTVQGLSAQLLVEDFDYGVGTLLTANGWNLTGTSTTAPLTVKAATISYANYASSSVGAEVALTPTGQDVNKTITAQTSGNVYVAFLANVTSGSTTGDYFLHLGATAMGTTFKGKVFAKIDASNKLAFGVSHSSNTGTFTAFSYDLNTTYLVVLKYAIVSGTINDVVSLYINPVPGDAEPASAWTVATDVPTADLTEVGSIGLRQGTTANNINVIVDGIRVATSWAQAVAKSSGQVTKTSAPSFAPGQGNYFTPQSVTITCATEGASIYYTTDGTTPDNTKTLYSAPVSISATTTLKAIAYKTGLEASNVSTATYTFPTEVANIAALRAFTSGIYKLTGEAVITLKTANRNAKYIQDATGAVLIDDAAGIITTSYNVGDGMKGLTGTLGVYSGMLQFTPVADPGAPSSTANVVTPKEIALADMVNYPGQLVKVAAVTIDGEGPFVSKTNYNLNGSSTTILRTAYDDLPYIGSSIPTTPQNITGVVLIFNTASQLVPRTADDFSNYVISNPTILITEVVASFNTPFGGTVKDTIVVNGYNLTENMTATISGDGATSFSVSPASIAPVGGAIVDAQLVITYNPVAAGDHVATLTLKSAGAADVVRTLTGKAYQVTGLGTADNPYTVSDVKVLNNTLGTAQKYWVAGYIVGTPSGGADGNLTTVNLAAPFTSSSAIALADAQGETNLTKLIGVQLTTATAPQLALNLKDNATNYGKKVKVYGTTENYFSAPGVKNVTDYVLNPNAVNPVDFKLFNVFVSDNKLNINAKAAARVQIFNTVGQIIYNNNITEGFYSIDVPKGMLVVKINEGAIKVVR